jgi:hypothetical protein
MNQYTAGEPYTARGIQVFTNRLERLARQANMDALLEQGVQAFIGFQSSLAALQGDIQRDITTLKSAVRKT